VPLRDLRRISPDRSTVSLWVLLHILEFDDALFTFNGISSGSTAHVFGFDSIFFFGFGGAIYEFDGASSVSSALFLLRIDSALFEFEDLFIELFGSFSLCPIPGFEYPFNATQSFPPKHD